MDPKVRMRIRRSHCDCGYSYDGHLESCRHIIIFVKWFTIISMEWNILSVPANALLFISVLDLQDVYWVYIDFAISIGGHLATLPPCSTFKICLVIINKCKVYWISVPNFILVFIKNAFICILHEIAMANCGHLKRAAILDFKLIDDCCMYQPRNTYCVHASNFVFPTILLDNLHLFSLFKC